MVTYLSPDISNTKSVVMMLKRLKSFFYVTALWLHWQRWRAAHLDPQYAHYCQGHILPRDMPSSMCIKRMLLVSLNIFRAHVRQRSNDPCISYNCPNFHELMHMLIINNNNNNFILSPKNPINSSVDFTSKEVYYYHSISHYQIGITFTMKDKYIIKNKESINLIKIVHRKLLLKITNYTIFTQIHTHMHAQHAENTHTPY